MTISIILCVHNGKPYVQTAIESVLAQTYGDFELVIVDDASTDGTREILAGFAQKDSRVRVITNDANLGLTKSLNIALREAQGVYVARMDADDVALPDRLAKQVAFLDAHPEIDVVGTAYEWIDEDSQVIGRPNVITEPDELHRALIRTNQFLHGSVMMRRAVIEKMGGYDERVKKAQDYELWLRLSRTSQFANLPDVLMQKRMTKNMISFKSEHEQITCALRARVAALRRGDYPLSCVRYLVKPLIAIILPIGMVRWARVHLFGQNIYKHPTLR